MGGVEIPYELGLLGHSDADVLIHAIMDALLGAAKMGDIGKLFPDTDPKYKGISSITLLKCVKEKMDEKGIKVVNIDSIIVAQKPKMRPYIEQMEKNIAQALDCDVDLINVKATTEEELGFTGRKEGIASKAVCLIEC
jgi:2-C-methyl-D-erythritol 2,4-cyclodiphosphate synthase